MIKNKKGWIANVLGGIVVIAILFLFLYLVIGKPSEKQKTICINQCLKQNLTFYEYNSGGYQNPACLCKDEKGIIKTIYTR